MMGITLNTFLSDLGIDPKGINGEDPTGGLYIEAFTVADKAIEAKNGTAELINKLNYVLSGELKIPAHKVNAFLNKYGLRGAKYSANS